MGEQQQRGQERKTELDELAVALARWLEAAQTLADDAESRLTALEDARARLASCTATPPVRQKERGTVLPRPRFVLAWSGA